MEKIINNEFKKENMDSYIFLQYMKSFGFKEENYENILELFQSPKTSIGQFLTLDKVYLLSNKVDIVSLTKMNMRGARGDINGKLENGIFLPKSLENDEILLRGKTLSRFNKVAYSTPSIDDFNVIIGNGYTKNIKDSVNFNIDKYVGCCMNIENKNSKMIIEMYRKMWLLST